MSLRKLSSRPHLGAADSLVDFLVEQVASTHLSDVHPAAQPGALQPPTQSHRLLLVVPLVADEDGGWTLWFCSAL